MPAREGLLSNQMAAGDGLDTGVYESFLDRRKLHTRGSIKIQDYVICYLFSFPTLQESILCLSYQSGERLQGIPLCM